MSQIEHILNNLDVQAFERQYNETLEWRREWSYHSRRHEELMGYPKAEAEVHEKWLHANNPAYPWEMARYQLFKSIGLIK